MESSANKALLIGVGIFITIMITSAILFILNSMTDVYSRVYNTDISLLNQFDEFDEYDNTVKTGIDVINTVKRYIGNSSVTIKFGSNYVLQKGELRNYIQGTNKLNATSLENGVIGLLNVAMGHNVGEGLAYVTVERHDTDNNRIRTDGLVTISFTRYN